MKLVYVAGPFNGLVEHNIRAAEDVGRRLVEMFSEVHPVIPHSIGRVLFGVQTEEKAYEGGRLLLSVCHGVVLTSRWQQSRGATEEREEALRLGLPVFEEREVFEMPDRFQSWLLTEK